tara:strand:+ start:582 stop:794 length:213 start_codon:yes stop_codon:yes gene_type:complete
MHNVYTIHGASMDGWLQYSDPALVRQDELKLWEFETAEEAAAFGLGLNYANQVTDCKIYMLDEREYNVLN